MLHKSTQCVCHVKVETVLYMPPLQDGAGSERKSYQGMELTKPLWGCNGILALGLASVAPQCRCQHRPAEWQVVAVGAVLHLQSSKPAGVSGTLAAHKNTCHRDYFGLVGFCLDTGPG